MKDMLTELKNQIMSEPRLQELVEDRISAYNYAEDRDHEHTFVVIYPLNPPELSTSGSDKPLRLRFEYQINVEGKNRKEVKEVQGLIRTQLLAFSFVQMSGGLDEYFVETKRFVDARRYSGNSKLYDTNY